LMVSTHLKFSHPFQQHTLPFVKKSITLHLSLCYVIYEQKYIFKFLWNTVTYEYQKHLAKVSSLRLHTRVHMPHQFKWTKNKFPHFQVPELVCPNTPSYRLKREEYWKRKLSTNAPLGLNKVD
jgi:hypothetical protein